MSHYIDIVADIDLTHFPHLLLRIGGEILSPSDYHQKTTKIVFTTYHRHERYSAICLAKVYCPKGYFESCEGNK